MNQEEAITLLSETLCTLKIAALVKECEVVGPLYRFKLRLVEDERIKQLHSSAPEIAIRMKSNGVPTVRENYPGGYIVLDFMFGDHPLVGFSDVVNQAKALNIRPGRLDICLGTTEITKPLIRDLTEMPHLLIGGTTGSGKSTALHTIVKSLTDGVLVKPKANLVLLDPKRVEFNRYDHLPDVAIGHSPHECLFLINTLQGLMKERLAKLAKKKCQNIAEYHERGYEMSYVVAIIDELADLVRALKNKFTTALCDLAERSRATGIHLVIATQDPRREIVNGSIKANFPARVGFKVVSGIHSKIILDRVGAEKLLGKGDAFLIDGALDVRFQGAFVSHTKVVPPPNFLRRLLGA